MSALGGRLSLRRRRSEHLDGAAGAGASIVGYSADRRGWNNASMRLLDPITRDAAMAAHLSGRTYSVVRRDAGQLIVIGFVNHHEISVTRYDASATVPIEVRELREIDGSLWLRGIKRCNGGHNVPPTEQVTDWFTWVRPDTTATWTRFDHESPQGRPYEVRLDWDPADHWLARPQFGDDAALIGHDDLVRRLWPSAGLLPVIAD